MRYPNKQARQIKKKYQKPMLVSEQVFTAEGTCTPTCGKTTGTCATVPGKCASNKDVS